MIEESKKLKQYNSRNIKIKKLCIVIPVYKIRSVFKGCDSRQLNQLFELRIKKYLIDIKFKK